MLRCILWVTLCGAPQEHWSEDLAALHRELVPDRQETWQTIPWELDLLEARSRAEREGRMLFLWSMNGHPLGCT